MAGARSEVITIPEGACRSGITIEFTRKGLRVSGWYDSMVGLESGNISWQEIDAIRARLFAKHPGAGE